jgi:GMP synthase (glutamine-hydrolysing)
LNSVQRRICIIKAGGTYPDIRAESGDFDNWIETGLGLSRGTVRIVDALDETTPLPAPAESAGVVISGAHAMITDDQPWMLRLAEWTRRMVTAQVPYLGICFGHQLLAKAMGGTVDFHPQGREIGTVPIELSNAAAADPLFAALPRHFLAHAVHAQSVRKLPKGATLLAGNAFEATHAFRIGSCAWGVQFHPEFTPERLAIYIEHLKPDLLAAGRDIDALRAGLAATPEAARLLPRFARIALADCFD